MSTIIAGSFVFIPKPRECPKCKSKEHIVMVQLVGGGEAQKCKKCNIRV